MKKLLFLFAVLLTSVGAWAQQPTFSQTSDAPSGGQWAANTTWFIVSNGQGYLLSKDFADASGNLKLTKNDSEATDAILWCVSGNDQTGYKLYNKAAGANMVLGITGDDGSARATFVTDGTANYVTAFDFVQSTKTGGEYWCLKAKDSEKKYWNRRGEYLGYWNSTDAPKGDNGSAFLFETVNLSDIKEYSYQLTDNADNLFEGRCLLIKENTKTTPQPTGVAGYSLTNKAWNGDIYTATINFPFPVSKTDGVTNRTFIFTNVFTNGHRAYIYTDDSGKIVSKSTQNADYGYLPTASDGEIQKWMWAIYPTFTNGKFTFQIKNISTEKFVPTATEETATINVSVTAGNFSWGACVSSGNGFYLSDKTNLFWGASSADTGTRDALIWNKTGSTHKGCNLEFTTPIYTAPISFSDDTDNEYSSFRGLINYTVQEGDIERPVISGILDEWITTVEWDNASCNVTVNYPFPVSTESGVTNKTMICSFASPSYKWHADGLNLRTAKNVEPSLEKLNLYYWAIYPKFNNGSFGFVVKNVGTGKYIYSTSNNNTHDPGVVTFADEGSVMTIEANNRFKLPTEKYLSLNSSTGKDGDVQYVGTYSTHDGCNLAFPTINSYTIATGTTGYASGYTPIAVTIPNGVKVYTGKMITANKASIILNELTDATVIPANTAFVIKGVASTTYTFNKSNAAGSPVANNVIMGSADNVATSSISNGVVYTMQADGTFQKYTGETILGCNAYIKMPTGTTDPVSILDEADFVNEVTDFKQGGVYTFVSSKGWVGATETCDNVISTAKAAHNATGLATDPMFQWAVLKSTNGNYYLYNLGKQKFMGVESRNNTSVPFSDTPAGKKMSFKQSSSTEYPIMFSTDNAAVVNHNGGYGDGCISWTGGWNNLTDAGNAHQVTLVKTLTAAELQPIANIVEAYDKQLYVTTQVEGSWNDNPNTHFGNVTATSTSGTLSAKLKTDPSKVMLDYDGLNETTISFTRAYRGFEFQGFFLGGENLGKSFTLTEAQEANVTEQNPLVAKFTATEAVTLFYDDDEFSYRIPAITTTGTGRIFAVSDYRHNLDDIGRDKHGTGTMRIDLVARYSDDNGKTWSETMTIAAGDDSKTGSYLRAFGDAAIAAVGENIVVMAAAGDQLYPYATTASPNRMVRIFSSDNGMTWSKEEMTTKMYNSQTSLVPNGVAAFFGSGKLVVDANFNGTEKARIYGALLVRTYINEQYNNYNNYVVYSDDLGVNWSILGGSQTPVASGDEPKVEILPNGQILLSARRGGGRVFNVFTYTDKANNAGTWDTAANGCGNGGSNATNGEIFCVDAKKTDGTAVTLLMQSQPKGGSDQYDRKDVTIWYKEVDANTTYTTATIKDNWTEGLQVSHQQSSYSAVTMQPDGRIALFFEEAPCYGDDYTKGYSMVYVPLTIESITKGNYFSPTTDLNATQTISVVLTDAQGNEYRDQVESTIAGVAAALATKYPFITLGDNAALESDGENFTYTNTVTLPFKVSNEETTVWHNIYWPAYGNDASQRYPVYLSASAASDEFVPKVTESNAYGNSTYNTANKADNISWAVYSIKGGFTFKFKNKLTGKFIQATGVATGDSKNVKYVDEASATAFVLDNVKEGGNCYGDYALKAEIKGTVGYLCSTSATGYHFATHYSGKGHAGAWVKFTEAPDFETLFAEVNAVMTQIQPLATGEVGMYSVTAVNQAIEAMKNPEVVTKKTLEDYKTWLTQAPVQTPSNLKLYRLKNTDSKRYMTAQNNGSVIMYATPALDASIFYLDADNCLLSYSQGLYLDCQDKNLEAIGTKWSGTFHQSHSGYQKDIVMYQNHESWTYGNKGEGVSIDKGANLPTGTGYDWTFEPVTSLPFTFKGAALGFATFCAPVNVQLYEGVVAYIAEIMDGDDNNYKLKMRRIVGDVVPANTPVLLYKEDIDADVTVYFNIDNVECNFTANDLKSQNHFHPTIEAENRESGCTYYSLQKGSDNKLGFYLKDYGTLGGFKAWIKLDEEPDAQGARTFTIIFDGDDATGLKEALGLENENVEIYDLSGRRLDKATKGVNIIGGKLVIK